MIMTTSKPEDVHTSLKFPGWGKESKQKCGYEVVRMTLTSKTNGRVVARRPFCLLIIVGMARSDGSPALCWSGGVSGIQGQVHPEATEVPTRPAASTLLE